MTTTSVFSISLSKSNPDLFTQYLPGFWDAIAKMEPLPTQVVIAHSVVDHCGVTNPPKDFPVKIKYVPVEVPDNENFVRDALKYMNAAMSAVETDWMSFCGLDDRMMPHAYKDIPAATEAGAEIVIGGVKLTTDSNYMSGWSRETLNYPGGYRMAAHCPFTKALYDRVGPWPNLYWYDVGWWNMCLKAGVEVYNTDNLFAIFDVGVDHPTISGPLANPERIQAAEIEATAFLKELWNGA